jgi:Spy/CpxP family protein refolding chaperone
MRLVASVLALAVALTFVGNLSAADKPSGKHGHPVAAPWDILKGLNLTDDQKAKVKELRKEYGSKYHAAADSVLTDEQKTARADAIKAAKAEGKKGPELHKAVAAAVKLTDEQKAKMKEAVKPLNKEFKDKLLAILTPEQKDQVKQNCEKKASK